MRRPADALPVGVRWSHAANRCGADDDADKEVSDDVARDSADGSLLLLLLLLQMPSYFNSAPMRTPARPAHICNTGRRLRT